MTLLLTGGSACGKSTYAEKVAAALPAPRFYIATMMPMDDECLSRINRHRGQRSGKNFETIERYTNLAGLRLPQRGTVVLECICNLAANEMFDKDGSNADPVGAVLAGVESLRAQCDNLIVVTNDVGSDGAGYDAPVRDYIRAIGRVNRALAAGFDSVAELCCGIPLWMKGDAL